jgi:tripartite-type tricarboxylate transporter receptor subunit TctC
MDPRINKCINSAMAAASLALLFQSGSIFAQAYPAKPIRLMVPYDTGGISDLLTRLIQPGMAAALGQPVVIENRPGAGGGVGTDQAAKAPADGYTVLSNFDSFATVPFLYANIQHDPLRDFAPVVLMARGPQVLAIDPKLGITTLDQFLQYARKKDSKLTFSTAGSGSSSRLSMELFRTAAKFDTEFVSYKGGAPAVNAILGGHVTGMMASIGVVINHVKAGKLVALGLSSGGRRSPLLPAVAPLSDTIKGFDAQSWIGLSVPAGTPRPIIDRLNSSVVQALKAQDVRDRLESQGMEVVGSTPDVYGEWLRTEINKWRPIIQSLNIKID